MDYPHPFPKPINTESNSTSSDSETTSTPTFGSPHKPLAVLSDHAGSISCLALCGEFVLSASHGRDIVVWQQPDLRPFARFGHADTGSVKSLVTVGCLVFSAHQDSRIRVWKISTKSENAFKLVATLPTTKDFLGRFLRQRNYVQTRRNHRRLWIQHADSISCLAVSDGLIYSGSWDKTLKVWRVSDLKCLESVRAHDDAINALVANGRVVYSASADGRIKAWKRDENGNSSTLSLKACLEGYQNAAWNAVIVCEDGRLVLGGGSDGRIMGWESDTWRRVCDVKAHDMAVLCLSATGEFVCSGSADKTIGVWRREEGAGGLCRVGIIRGHEGPVKCLQASESGVGEGFMLYSGGLDRRLRVWWVPKDYGEANTEEERLMERCIVLS